MVECCGYTAYRALFHGARATNLLTQWLRLDLAALPERFPRPIPEAQRQQPQGSNCVPPEIFRSERFDAVFMIDLPGRQEKNAIWEMYLAKFRLDARQARPADDQWTGAEIRACCRLAALLEVALVQAAENVVPVAVTAAESVERLRGWASGRCLSADKARIYRSAAAPAVKPGRKISRDRSSN